MNAVTETTAPDEAATALPDAVQPPRAQSSLTAYSSFASIQAFETGQRMAKALASSTMIPERFRDNMVDCLIVLEMSQRMGCSPLMLMQKIYEVHGKIGIEAQFLIASVNQSGKCTPIRYDEGGEGDDQYCIAWVMDKTGERLSSVPVTLRMAKQEKWTDKPGSKWKTMPGLMLRYRAAAFLARQYFPELSLGMPTREELVDSYEEPGRVEPARNIDDLVTGKDIPGELVEDDDDATVPADAEVEPDPVAKLIQEIEQAATLDDVDVLEDECR